jgi:hypothetical protein
VGIRAGFVVVALALVAGACGMPRSDFHCADSVECTLGATSGICQPNGYCSFPDPGCRSGQRYGEDGPDGVGGVCVGLETEVPDAAVAEEADAATVNPDAALGTPDAHVAMPDAHVAMPDAHVAMPDAHVATPDAALPDAGVPGQVMPFVAVADAWIDSLHPTQNHGADPVLRVSGDPRNALLRFDVAALPSNATITAVELHLFTTGTGALSTGSVQVFRLLQGWVEGTKIGTDGTVNWTQRSDTADWTSAGAGNTGASPSRSSIVSGELAPSANDAEYVVALPVSLVQGWHAGSIVNYGVVLVAKNAGAASASLVAREGTPATKRPTLKVFYTVP